jgi:hypothetical protein
VKEAVQSKLGNRFSLYFYISKGCDLIHCAFSHRLIQNDHATKTKREIRRVMPPENEGDVATSVIRQTLLLAAQRDINVKSQ